ncbi:MAG: MFS transporter [Candidatus Omnitrophota bacterium]
MIFKIFNKFNAHRGLMFRSLRNRNYRHYYFAWGVSSIGTWMQAVSMGWLVYRLTHSPLLLGTVVFVSQAPSIVLSPFAGVFSDRHDRRLIMFGAQLLLMLQACVLTAIVLTGSANTSNLIGLALFLGIVNAVDFPIRQSFIKELVDDKDDLANAIALNASVMNLSKFIGPFIAGILIAVVGEGWCFMLNAVSFIPILLVLSFLKVSPRELKVNENGSVWAELKEGIGYALRSSPIRMLLLMLGVISFLEGAVQSLMPVFVKEQYRTGSEVLGFIIGAAGVGALVAALYLAGRQNIRGLWRHIGVALPALGIFIVIFGHVHDARWAGVLAFLIGFTAMIHVASTNSILQTILQEDKRGRIMSLYGTTLVGGASLGSITAGAVSSLMGLPLTYTCGGCLALLAAFFYWRNLARVRAKVLPIYIEKGIVAG